MKIAMISDLHGFQGNWFENLIYSQWGWEKEMKWNDSDMIIFSGDCTGRGYKFEVENFLKWFSKQPAKYKVMIAGNHDFFFEEKPKEVEELLKDYPDIIYLNDSSVEIEGLKIWGSPIQPWFHDWAFNRQRGEDIKKHWDLIPNDTDILVIHGPPRNILDRISPKFERYNENPNVGCDDLKDKINEVKPKLVVFGHIHEGYGRIEENGITYVNASSLDDNYRPMNPPQFIDLEKDEK